LRACSPSAIELGLAQRRGRLAAVRRPETQPIIERFVPLLAPSADDEGGLETLAIVAYNQPVTRHQVSAIEA
jgi:chromosome segregation and condensation protein ScpB